MARTATRTSRIELRAEPARERRIRYAAELCRQSVTAFVLEAAARRADEVITSSTATIVPSRFFDALYRALDQTPRPSRTLHRRAASKRHVIQR
jgi:uncharacterized protein (DUF1778 family)